MKRWVGAGVVALLVVVTTILVDRSGSSSVPDGESGQTAVDFALGWRAVKGETWPSGEVEGLIALNSSAAAPVVDRGVVLVNVWASTCGPCREEMPALEQLSKKNRVSVVGISRDIMADYATETLQSFGVTYPNFADTEARLSESLADVVPVGGVPSSLIVVDGEIRWAHIGPFKNLASLERDISARIS